MPISFDWTHLFLIHATTQRSEHLYASREATILHSRIRNGSVGGWVVLTVKGMYFWIYWEWHQSVALRDIVRVRRDEKRLKTRSRTSWGIVSQCNPFYWERGELRFLLCIWKMNLGDVSYFINFFFLFMIKYLSPSVAFKDLRPA